jgi:hypothetical protein
MFEAIAQGVEVIGTFATEDEALEQALALLSTRRRRLEKPGS